jgi:tetratricopeptide (TPR) repeat protein
LLGRLIGADGIVTGKVIDLGDTLDVKVRLIQTETGKIISVAQVELANDRKMQRLSVQAYEKPKTDTRDKIQGLDQLKQASELVDKEDWQGLQKLAEPWTVSEPGNSYAWFNLGYAYKKLKQYDRAVRASQEALRIEPNDPWTWGNLGQAYNNLNQYDKAVTAYQEAVRIKPDYADAWYNLGLVYRDLKQYDKAVATLQEAVRIDPKDAAGWYALGDAYHDLKQYDKAVTAFQEVVRIKPEYADAWNNLGHVYRELKQYDKAVTAFQYALRFEPDYVLSWYSLGVVYLNQGRSGKAYKAYQTLRKLDASMADTFSNAVLKERWLRYATSDGGSVYFIDFRSISPVSESIVKVWAKIDINKNDKDFLKMREALREKGSLENAMDYVEINCVESKIRFLSTMWYDKEGILDRSEVAPISWTDG